MRLPLKDAVLVPLAVLLGAVPRLVWAFRQIGNPDLNFGEAYNAAINFALTGIISSPYRPNAAIPPDNLPTAHLLPIPVGIAAGVFHVFGINTAAANVVLTLLAVTLCLTSYVLFYFAFGQLGLSRAARLGALFALALIPLDLRSETEDFRYWEGGYAVALTALLLLVFVRLDKRAVIPLRVLFGVACLDALLFFLSPQLGIASYACLALLLWRRVPFRRWPAAAALAVVALAFFIVPWAIRNDRMLGKPILLRSNLGLELTLAFHPDAVPGNEKASFEHQYVAIHPNLTEAAFARMKAAGGEVPYAEALGRQTVAWIQANPGTSAWLAVRHLRDYFFPPSWNQRIFSDEPLQLKDMVRLILLWGYSALGLIGCVYALLKLDVRYQYSAIFFIVSALPFVLVQPVLRYHYIMYAHSVFLSFVVLQLIAFRVPGAKAAAARLE